MASYYFVSYVENEPKGTQKYHYSVTRQHPIQYVNGLNYKRRGGQSTFALLNWKEITEEEYLIATQKPNTNPAI